MLRNFFEMFLRARRALEFSHSQDPTETLVAQDVWQCADTSQQPLLTTL